MYVHIERENGVWVITVRFEDQAIVTKLRSPIEALHRVREEKAIGSKIRGDYNSLLKAALRMSVMDAIEGTLGYENLTEVQIFDIVSDVIRLD